MSYLVLARKYRPQKFAEIVGQEHITEILKKSVSSDRVAHAYLFCGPRGIGKTSCARILAKALNCEKGPTPDPCNTCPACQEVIKANSFDVIEIDGASNRGIDEIRTLRENVKFAPSYGRYKVYIVDEVHMLTTEAFNALLKTLEEPPEHVKFILATTAPNKLPPTIISRCQRFDFKRVSLTNTLEMLKSICTKEKFEIDDDALFAIAKASQGSLRDSLSILDQLSALSEGTIKTDDVCSMLGLVETELLFELVDALGRKDCQAALDTFDKIIGEGKDIKQLSKDVTEHFRHLMVIKVGGKALGRLVDYPVAVKDMILEQTKEFELAEILKAIDILIEAQEVSRITESLRMPLEVAFAKIAYDPDAAPKAPKAAKAPSPKAQAKPENKPPAATAPRKFSPQSVLKNEKGHVDLSAESLEDDDNGLGDEIHDQASAEYMMESKEPVQVLDLEKVKRSWDAITHSISRERMSAATYLQDGSPCDLKGSVLVIGFAKDASFQKECLETPDMIQLIERNFSDKLRQKIRVELRVMDNHMPQEEEPFIKDALSTFKGKVVNKWHKETI